MPTTYDEIDLTGMNIDNVGWTGSRLRVSFGHGYGAFALTGNAAGLHKWKLSDGGVLPDRTTADCLPIGSQSRFDYYYEFFKSHTTGSEEVFIIEWRGKKYHACFTDPTQGFDRFTEDLFTGGVDVQQRRVAGFLYHADGSLDGPPSVPVLLSLTVLDAYSIEASWSASTDPSGDIYPLAGYELLIDETTIIDVGNVLSAVYAFFGPDSIHEFKVRSYDSAPSPNFSDWSNALSATTDPTPPEELIVDSDGAFLTDIFGETLSDG